MRQYRIRLLLFQPRTFDFAIPAQSVRWAVTLLFHFDLEVVILCALVEETRVSLRWLVGGVRHRRVDQLVNKRLEFVPFVLLLEDAYASIENARGQSVVVVWRGDEAQITCPACKLRLGHVAVPAKL